MPSRQPLTTPARNDQAGRRFLTGLPRSCCAFVFAVLLLAPGCQDQPASGTSGSVIELTDANFQSEVLESSQPVLVEFWAPWCQPCLEMAPAIEQIARELSGRAKVGRLHIDEHPAVPSRFDVHAPPAVIVFRNGQILKRRTGKQTLHELRALIAKAVTDDKAGAGSAE